MATTYRPRAALTTASNTGRLHRIADVLSELPESEYAAAAARKGIVSRGPRLTGRKHRIEDVISVLPVREYEAAVQKKVQLAALLHDVQVNRDVYIDGSMRGAEIPLRELFSLVRDMPVEHRPALKEVVINLRKGKTITGGSTRGGPRREPGSEVETAMSPAAPNARATADAAEVEVVGPRPQWTDYKDKVTLPKFVAWAYAAEREAGTLTRATFYDDQKLYTDYYNWRRKPNLPSEEHWLRDLRTGKALRDQQDAEAGVDRYKGKSIEDFEPQAQEAIRTYNKVNRRAQRRARLRSLTP